jgi:hypothetical protein
MIKMIIFTLLCTILTLSHVACSADNRMVLEKKDIQFFNVEEKREEEAIILRISGLAFHSSLSVSDIKTEIQGTSLLVFVFLAPARDGRSGSFSFEVSVPASVKDVCFGNEKTIIWERHR